MFKFHYISAQGLAFVDSWISDLQRSHYLEPPIIPRRRGSMNPCLGADGLYGVAFYPALAPRGDMSVEQAHHRNQTLERYLSEEALLDALNRAHSDSLRRLELEGMELVPRRTEFSVPVAQQQTADANPVPAAFSRHAKVYEPVADSVEEMPLLYEFTDSACPGYSHLLPHRSANPMHNILLIVAMTSLRYDMIPMFEVIYREQFRNILYCGGPHDSIEIFLRKYQLSENRSFSFLPMHTKYTYECVLGAIEMGYNVDGYIMTSDDSLVNSWNIPQLNASRLWYGGDHNIQVTGKNWRSLDPGSQKLPRSLDGVLKVLEFLKSSLIGTTDNQSSYHEYKAYRLSKREAIIEPFEPIKEELSPGSDPLLDVEGLELSLSRDNLAFDLVELKAFNDEKEHSQFPSFKYDVSLDSTSVTNDTSSEPISQAETPSTNATLSGVDTPADDTPAGGEGIHDGFGGVWWRLGSYFEAAGHCRGGRCRCRLVVIVARV